MALPVHSIPHGTVFPDGDGAGPHQLAPVVNSKQLNFTFANATTDLFSLPAGAVIIGWEAVIKTAFNAGTTNTLSLGDGTTAARFASALALGTAGFVKAGFVISEMFTPLTTDVTFRATYNQSGGAATAGEAYIVVYYTVP